MQQAKVSIGAIAAIIITCAIVIAGVMYVAVCACIPVRLCAPHEILQLYQLMKDADETFAKHGVPYLVESGTLLGAVRHQGIIPFDDDLDIQVWQHDKAALINKAFPALNALGYKWSECAFGYKVTYANRKGFPCMDIFIVHEDGIRTHITDHSFDICHYLLSEMYPVTRYKFGETEVNGPRDPTGFLNRAYKQWQNMWMPSNSHKHLCFYFGAQPQRMLPEHYVPAYPTGPLEDRC